MKFILRIILTGIVLFHISPIFAQTKNLYAGTKTPYPVANRQYTPPPPGFTPVFVNHVGRHGARFFTKAGSDATVLQVLQEAQKNKALTALGQQMLVMTQKFISIQQGNYENITGLGATEQRAIGQRLLHNYPGAFAGKGLEIFATYKVRTQQSATAFLDSFKSYTGKQQYHLMPDSLDTLLRFYDLSPGYQAFKKSAAILQPLDSLLNDPKTKQVAQQVCHKLFAASFKTDPIEFATALYDVYCGQLSVPEEMKKKGIPANGMNFSKAFTVPQLQWFDLINGAEDFLEKGAGRDTAGIQATVAAPLLNDFIITSNEVISGARQTDAILRFTHAEAISPFATLLGIPEASVPAASIYKYNQHWSAAQIIPLSANIQWIIYSNGAEYLVKVLLNEKEARLPVPTQRFPYYKWENVKEYYEGKLKMISQ